MLAERRRLELGQLRRLEIVSLIEGSTLVLLLFVAVPLKHLAGLPLAVTVVGPIHGLAFLAYAWTAIETVAGGEWRRSDAARLFVVAFLPFGGFANLAWLRRRAAGLAAADA